MRKLTTQEWVQRAKEVHKNAYNYCNSTYVNKRTKIIIKCNTCNTTFNQWPTDHINGCGCSKCALSVGNPKYTTKNFIEKATVIFDNKYNYSNVLFTNIEDKIEIRCNTCNEVYYQKASSHIGGHHACPCHITYSGGFKINKPALLYYLSINNGELFKIGITNRTVQERFLPYELKSIEIVRILEFSNGKDALKEEQRILSEFSEYKYVGPKVLTSGNTELFTKDILNLYKKDQL